MRYPALILALAGAALLTGCSSLISLDPFVTEDQAASDPNLLGVWQGAGDDDKDLTVIRQKGSAYTIRYFGNDKDMSLGFEGRLCAWEMRSSWTLPAPTTTPSPFPFTCWRAFGWMAAR